MQAMATVVSYVDMLRPGHADAGGDMSERTLGVGLNLPRGGCGWLCQCSLCAVLIV